MDTELYGLPVGMQVVDVPGFDPVDLWWAGTSIPRADLDILRADLDEATDARAARMLRYEDTARIVVAHVLARRVVADLLGVAPSAVDLRHRCPHCGSGDHGRPFVLTPDGRPAPEVSLAHAGALAVVAVAAAGRRIGVDVEPFTSADTLAGFDEVMDSRAPAPHGTILHPGTWPAVRRAAAGGAGDVEQALLRSWTCTEAVAKATGQGMDGSVLDPDAPGARLPVDPRRFADSPVPSGREWFRLDRPASLVTFRTVRPEDSPAPPHLMALAVLQPDAPDDVPGCSWRTTT
jgi:phosphopantetheinyl transferase